MSILRNIPGNLKGAFLSFVSRAGTEPERKLPPVSGLPALQSKFCKRAGCGLSRGGWRHDFLAATSQDGPFRFLKSERLLHIKGTEPVQPARRTMDLRINAS